jgi:hypothetical protein
MATYKVEISFTKTETYLVDAKDETEAEDNVFIDGALVDSRGEDYAVTEIAKLKKGRKAHG